MERYDSVRESRVAFLELRDSLYLVVEGCEDKVDGEIESRLLLKIGLDDRQLATELLVQLACEFGTVDGRFVGEVVNSDLPVSETDGWCELPRGRGTWSRRPDGYFDLRPVGLGDLRTAVRCGDVVLRTAGSMKLTITTSIAREGLTIHGANPIVRDFIASLVRGFGLPFVEDARLAEYIASDGELRY